MFRFAFKKAFFDLWDHLFFALAVNLVYVLVTVGLSSLGFLAQGAGPTGALLFLPIPFLAAAVLGGVASFWAKDLVLQGQARFSDFLAHLAASWKASLVFGVAWLVLAAGVIFGVSFYGQINQYLGLGFGVVMAWAAFFLAGLGLYYPGLNAQVEPNLRKLFKKSFMVFLANPWTSFVAVLVTLGSVVLTVVTLGFFPGILGISIWLQVVFRFLLAKYDWIETHPDEDAKKVPWALVLAEDMEKIGPRTLRSLIFPWKD